MHTRFLALLVVFLLAGASNHVTAGPVFSISSPTNLSSLTVGQTFEVDVNISGLPVGTDFIFNVNTKILFSSSLFTTVADPNSSSGLTATVTPGSVFYNNVQGPLQIANFDSQSSLSSSAAIGDFSESPNTNSGAIGLNGIYYSFKLTAKSAGTGSILFDPTSGANQYASNDTGFNYAPIQYPVGGNSLTFTISSVPEPSSLAMLLGGIATVGSWTLSRKRSARSMTMSNR